MKNIILIWALFFTTLAHGYNIGFKGQGQSTPSYPAVVDFGTNSIEKSGSNLIVNQSSDKNYILNPGAEYSTTGWSTYADAAATSPVDMTGGSPASTFTRSTSSPLNDSASFVFSKSAANRQGEGFSYAFSIDNADTTKVLRIDFNYKVSSGTYADDDMQCWIYDTTNSALIQPAPFKIKNVTGIEPAAMEFQATTSTTYRFGCHVASTSTSAYDLKFDKFKISRGMKVYTVGETGYSGSVSATGVISGTNLPFFSSCTNSSGVATCTIKTSLGLTTGPVCIPTRNDTASSDQYAVTSQNSTTVVFTASGAATSRAFGYFCQKTGADYANATAGRVSSSEADTRVTAAIYSGNPTASISTSYSTIKYPTVVKDTHGAYNTSTGAFVAPSEGYWDVSATAVINGTGITAGTSYFGLAISIGGSIKKATNKYADTTTEIENSISGRVYALAGQSITIDVLASGVTSPVIAPTLRNTFDIAKSSGPSQIAASETVSASYWVSANFAASTTTPINFDSKEWDSHGNFCVPSPTAFKCTAPISGTYKINNFGNITTATNTVISLYKNGTSKIACSYHASGSAAAGSCSVKLLANEYVDLRPSSSVSCAGGATPSGGACYMQIERTGNF